MTLPRGAGPTSEAEVAADLEGLGVAGPGIALAPTYGDRSSFQTIAADLNLEAKAGKPTGEGTSFLAAVMGNVIGDGLTRVGTYLAGLIGAFSITGARATTYPAAAVIGDISDGVSEADGAFVAVIDGDSAQTNARAAFTVDNLNSTEGSGFDYVLDAQGPDAHDGYPAGAPLKAPIRLGGDVCLLFGSGAPVDGAEGTGAGFAGESSLYFRTHVGDATVYINTGTAAAPVWGALATA